MWRVTAGTKYGTLAEIWDLKDTFTTSPTFSWRIRVGWIFQPCLIFHQKLPFHTMAARLCNANSPAATLRCHHFYRDFPAMFDLPPEATFPYHGSPPLQCQQPRCDLEMKPMAWRLYAKTYCCFVGNRGIGGLSTFMMDHSSVSYV